MLPITSFRENIGQHLSPDISFDLIEAIPFRPYSDDPRSAISDIFVLIRINILVDPHPTILIQPSSFRHLIQTISFNDLIQLKLFRFKAFSVCDVGYRMAIES